MKSVIFRMPSGHLASAVISASIRDPSTAQTIPVAVQYTLSSSHVVRYKYLNILTDLTRLDQIQSHLGGSRWQPSDTNQ